MSDEFANLTRAARQLLAIEELLGGDFVPAERNPLPQIEPAAPTQAAEAVATAPELPDDQKPGVLEALRQEEVESCQKCVLCKSRTQTVFGEGSATAELMFIGEGPGADEDASGRPFVGRAGKLLGKMITAMGLSREQVYICNIVKCRPPNNRTPLPEEVQSCWNYLVRQIQIIRPKAIVTLGAPASKTILDTREGITRLRGNWQSLPPLAEGVEGIPVMPTFHPSFVLRRYTKEIRGQVWSDLKQVMDYLGLDVPAGD